MQFFRVINLDDAFHIFLLYQVYDLSTICHNFDRLTRHNDLFVIKDFPVNESTHDSSENLIEIFVYWRMLIAKLFRLVKQILAQQIALNFDLIDIHAFIFI